MHQSSPGRVSQHGRPQLAGLHQAQQEFGPGIMQENFGPCRVPENLRSKPAEPPSELVVLSTCSQVFRTFQQVGITPKAVSRVSNAQEGDPCPWFCRL